MPDRDVDIVAEKLLQLPFATGYAIGSDESITLVVCKEKLEPTDLNQIRNVAGGRSINTRFMPVHTLSVPSQFAGSIVDSS